MTLKINMHFFCIAFYYVHVLKCVLCTALVVIFGFLVMEGPKYLIVFALVEIFVIVVLVLNTSMTSSDANLQVGKREILFDTRLKNQNTIDIDNDNKSKIESIILTHLLRKRKQHSTEKNFDKTGNFSSTNGDIIHKNENVHTKAFRQHEEEPYPNAYGNDFPFDSEDSFDKNDVSNKTSENKTTCTFFFDRKSLLLARTILSESKSVYLFYIRLHTSDEKPSMFTPSEREMLFHWQYVLKKEKYLVELPIDFDLITYNLLKKDDEEMFLNITLLYNNSNCETNFSTALQSIQNLLWNDLSNDADFYFCYRNINVISQQREYLYDITTIWVGYDLLCFDNKGKSKELNKDQLPLDIPIFCYMLSLQFIWILAILDKKESYQMSNGNTNDQKNCYFKGDRPYGLKRIIRKLLFVENKCLCEKTDKKKENIGKFNTSCFHKLNVLNNPVKRLFFILYIILLFPAVYRTAGRAILLKKEYFQDYNEIVRPSEPLFYHFKLPFHSVYVMDIVYATIFPLFFIWIGELHYNLFLYLNFHSYAYHEKNQPTKEKENKTTCRRKQNTQPAVENEKSMLINEENKDTKSRCFKIFASYCQKEIKETENNYVIDAFSIPFGNLFAIVCCNCDKLDEDGQNTNEEEQENASQSKVKDLAYQANDNISQENAKERPKIDENRQEEGFGRNETNANESQETNKNSRDETCLECCTAFIYKGILCFISLVSGLLCCLFPIISFKCSYRYVCKHYFLGPSSSNEKCPLIMKLLKSFAILCLIPALSYCFCIRPILSSFTFMIRSFTYFVFVALLIRTHIMRYVLIFVTTFIYFLKYLSEIINMNAEILDEIFNLTAEGTEKIDEKMFGHIYSRLFFVRKRFYYLCLKILLIFIYIFIMVQTFIHYKDSLTGSSFDHILEFLLILVGPYAITIFLKTKTGNFLSDKNKDEIKKEFDNYPKEQHEKSSKTQTYTPSTSHSQNYSLN